MLEVRRVQSSGSEDVIVLVLLVLIVVSRPIG